MKIIDFARKGNVVRFYLGEKTEDWGWTNPNYKDYKGNTPDWLKPQDRPYGDDWNDYPYDCNAGEVYDEFIKGYKDIAFDFDDVVLEPCNSYEDNCEWCKDDMWDRKVPCIIVVPKEVMIKNGIDYDWQIDNFNYAIKLDGIKKYYFGDELE